MTSLLSKKLPNPVFSRLLKEVARRDEIIKQHINNYKVGKNKCQRIKVENVSLVGKKYNGEV